jgi:hypothetical protein
MRSASPVGSCSQPAPGSFSFLLLSASFFALDLSFMIVNEC